MRTLIEASKCTVLSWPQLLHLCSRKRDSSMSLSIINTPSIGIELVFCSPLFNDPMRCNMEDMQVQLACVWPASDIDPNGDQESPSELMCPAERFGVVTVLMYAEALPCCEVFTGVHDGVF